MEVRGLSAGAERPEALGSGGQGLVNFGKFRLEALHGSAGQGHAQFPQGTALLVRQYAAAASVAREFSFLHAQHQNVLALLAAHGGGIAYTHRIQHRRDGPHVILAQKQAQESRK